MNDAEDFRDLPPPDYCKCLRKSQQTIFTPKTPLEAEEISSQNVGQTNNLNLPPHGAAGEDGEVLRRREIPYFALPISYRCFGGFKIPL